MKTWLRDLFVKGTADRNRPRHSARLAIESLEDRRVPAVTFHGGAVLPNVEVQALYLGGDWTSSTYYKQTGALEGFLKTTASDSYLDALTNAGYGTGRGTFSQGIIAPVSINKGYYLTDGTIQADVQTYIKNGALQAPDANRLYFVYVEDNVAVSSRSGNSQKDFLGYHSSFAGTDASGRPTQVRYAVITYPGGSIRNEANNALSTLDGMTATSSHELGEAVTDPDLNAWFDKGADGEVGDITNGQTVYLNGYAVQRLSDKNDKPMTPPGATTYRPVSFVLQTNGNVLERTSAGLTPLFGGVAAIGGQGIDNNGRAMIDVITTDGRAYEFHDGSSGWYPLASGVKDAEAGQGVSYVLLTNGSVYEYQDTTGRLTYLGGGASSISAGTDAHGSNAVDVVLASGVAFEYSDSTGSHNLSSGVKAVSAGASGVAEVVLQNGQAYEWRESTGALSRFASGVAVVTAGNDPAGGLMIDLVYNNGDLYEYRAGSWTKLGTGVGSVSKARAGLVDIVSTGGNAYEHSAGGTTFLTGSAVAAN